VFGLSITFVTSANSKDEAKALLRHIGLPLKKEEEVTKKK
jgi:ribosomal protein L5